MQTTTDRTTPIQASPAQTTTPTQESQAQTSPMQNSPAQSSPVQTSPMQNTPGQSTSPNVADVILSQMSLWGIQHIYGLAGDAVIPLLDAIQNQQAVRYIGVRHESAAAF